jgi:sigma-B regulation protein RsbU (phosphoserine phosphatase)
MSGHEGRDAESLFALAPAGYAVTGGDGVILRANAEFCRLVGRTEEDLVERHRLSDLLSVGGRIFFETHLSPLLEREAAVREISLAVVRPDGTRVPVLLNANASGPEAGGLLRIVLIEARDRHRFEEDLLRQTQAANQARRESEALATTLQQILIPPAPPEVPHLRIAGAYRPAGSGNEVGGDFYDVFRTGAMSHCVVLGDVSGKGVHAALVTSFVRYTVRSLTMTHPDPAEVLRLLDHALKEHKTERFCTLALLRLDWVDGGWDVRIALAGHPPALVRTPDGKVRDLGVYGTALGLVDGGTFTTVEHRLGGDSVTLFTDGVTEARGEQGLFGEERLREVVASTDPEPTVLTESIVREVLAYQHGNASDDIAVISLAAAEA